MNNIRCFFDESGNLYLPMNIKFGGELDPPLSPKEWWYLVLSKAENVPKDKEKMLWKCLIGSPTTKHRIRKKLKIKNYL